MININDIFQADIATSIIIALITVIVVQITTHSFCSGYMKGLQSGCILVLATVKQYMDEKLAALAQDNNTDHTQSVNLDNDEFDELSKRYKDEMRKIRAFIQANNSNDNQPGNLEEEGGCGDELDEIIDCWQKELSQLKIDLRKMIKDLPCSNRHKDF